MSKLGELKRALAIARYDAQDWEARFGKLSREAQMGREQLQKAEAAYRLELLAIMIDC